MRLIDADKLLMHLADIKASKTPTGKETFYKQDRLLAIIVGLEYAEKAIKDAPTEKPEGKS